MADRSQLPFRDVDWSVADELLVATEHMGFVRNLIAPQIRAELANRPLGLTRLLLSTEEAVDVLDECVSATSGARGEEQALRRTDAGHGAADVPRAAEDRISAIARDLRALAIAQHGGWMPTLGRNRLLSLPGSFTLGATKEISFGAAAGGSHQGPTKEIAFGKVAASGSVQAAKEISFGGGGHPSYARHLAPGARPTGPGEGVRVGLLDTRLWPHPWLAGGWAARPVDVLTESDAPGHVAGHGTFVAGLILSQAPGATVVARRVLDDYGHGTAWEVAEAIVELGRSVDVLNLSFACYTADGQPPLALARAVDRLGPDVVVVAAAGNHALNGKQARAKASADAAAFQHLVSWPAALDDVIAVGAVDELGKPASFSPKRPWVDVAALGVDVQSTYLPRTAPVENPMSYGEGWAEWSGTSFSAGSVSGAIAAGIDPGRVEAPEAAASLLAAARVVASKPRSGKVVPPNLVLHAGALAQRQNKAHPAV